MPRHHTFLFWEIRPRFFCATPLFGSSTKQAKPKIKSENAILCDPVNMRFSALSFLLGSSLLVSGISFARNAPKADCVSFAEASKHVGAAQCISGTVMHVEDGRDGVTLLHFCKDSKACPFTVVVFPGDLKKMGDVRQLEGRQIEIKGTVQDYQGHQEIVLRRPQQLGDAAFLLVPAVPTDYDVERRGHNSAGKSLHPKAAKKTTAKQKQPISIEDPDEPQ
jgi:DNA/RNA endonuclease YhcR with UshA esterase domain